MKNIKFNIALLFAAFTLFSCQEPTAKVEDPSEWLTLETQIGVYDSSKEEIIAYNENDHQIAYSLTSGGTYTNRIQNDDVTVYASIEFAAGIPLANQEDVKIMVKAAGVEKLNGIGSYEADVIAAKDGLVYLWDKSKSMGFIVKGDN